jgi:O-antigen ligase/polysaccharide polymerase Wzy-like membrane protein
MMTATSAKLPLLAGITLLGAFWGAAVAVAGLNALYLAATLLGCAFILLDFRVGVVLLIVLMPLSRSSVFPHAMLGVTGLNPFNLLLLGTLCSCLLHALFDGSLRRFVPTPLLWLYLVPIALAGALGARHVDEIAPGYYLYELLDFHDVAGYVRDMVAKPLFLVVFALLVGAAVARSERPEKFLGPMLLAAWVMGLLVVVFVAFSGVALDELAGADSRGALSPLGLHANELGRLYVIAYALLLFTWAESTRPGMRLALAASMALVAAALLLTFSRGAFFGFLLVNLLFLLWRRNARTLLTLGLLTAAALLFLPGAVYDRVTIGFDAGLNAVSAGRLEGLWLPLAPELLRSPVFGNGLGSILWSDTMRQWSARTIVGATHPHSAYLECILDMGFAGLILVCAYFAHVWKGFRTFGADAALSPELRGFFQGAAAALVSFLIAGATDSSLAPKAEQAFLWLAIGMMYGLRARGRGQ